MLKPSFLIFIMIFAAGAFGQSELLTNAQVIEMTQAGLSPEIVLRKVRTTNTSFDLTAAGLIELKKASVADSVIKAMIDRGGPAAQQQHGQHALIFRKRLDTEQHSFHVRCSAA